MKAAVILVLAVLTSCLIYWGIDTYVINPEISSREIDFVTTTSKVGLLPNFDLNRLDGGLYSSSEPTDATLTIVHFWASWCEPCAKEFPSLVKAATLQSDVLVVAISLDTGSKEVERFMQGFGELPKNFLVVWDPLGKTSSLFGSEKLPESYIFSADKRLIKKIGGAKDWMSPFSQSQLRSWVPKG